MAQVMRYHRYPSSYNWSAMPNQHVDYGWGEVAQLMRDCGDAVDMDWGCTESSADTEKVKGALKDLGYSNEISYQNFDRSRVMTDIDRSRPVILRGCSERDRWLGSLWYVYGGCHAWVCDGVKKIVSSNGSTTTELNMNWGWGHGTDWTYDFETPGGTRFQFVRKMMINIHP